MRFMSETQGATITYLPYASWQDVPMTTPRTRPDDTDEAPEPEPESLVVDAPRVPRHRPWREKRLERIEEIERLRGIGLRWDQVADDLGLKLASLQKNLERWRRAGLTNLVIHYWDLCESERRAA